MEGGWSASQYQSMVFYTLGDRRAPRLLFVRPCLMIVDGGQRVNMKSMSSFRRSRIEGIMGSQRRIKMSIEIRLWSQGVWANQKNENGGMYNVE